MKTRLIAAATVASFALAGAAFAGSTATTGAAATKPDQKCTALITQFDAAVKTHANYAQLTQAKTLGASGQQMCQSKKEDGGIKDLEKALKLLGVKPTA